MARNETKRDIRLQLDFYEGLIKRTPKDVELLKVMGDLYSKTGDHQKGLEIDQKLARLLPRDPMSHYNLACSYALLRQNQKAVKSLTKAIHLGYCDWDWMKSDPDLKSLRLTIEFQSLCEEYSNSSKSH
ncbi:hypothetical protein QPK87_23225 [Kamptonema cortianum]|nr:hypothetical protein [Kamptonema cortianum]MDL5044538.1 hypothetical protein [Oscillatoria amoena NRMC-F 0135]